MKGRDELMAHYHRCYCFDIDGFSVSSYKSGTFSLNSTSFQEKVQMASPSTAFLGNCLLGSLC
jgi:hypothetical protein